MLAPLPSESNTLQMPFLLMDCNDVFFYIYIQVCDWDWFGRELGERSLVDRIAYLSTGSTVWDIYLLTKSATLNTKII